MMNFQLVIVYAKNFISVSYYLCYMHLEIKKFKNNVIQIVGINEMNNVH